MKSNGSLPIFRGFGNFYVRPLFKSNISLCIDEVKANIEVYVVVEDRYLSQSLLVGQNFTELSNIYVLKDSNKLNFYNAPIIEKKLRTIKLRNSDELELNGIQLLSVHNDPCYTGDVYVEAQVIGEPGKECRVHQGVYKLDNCKENILVSNHLNSFMYTLCRALAFEEVDVKNVLRIKTNLESLVENSPLKKEDIQVGSNISEDIKDRLYLLLQNYRDCFTCSLDEIGCAPKEYEMTIELRDDKPVVYRPYRLSHSERAKVRDMITELLDNDIIRESTSDYASPILLVKNKSGEQRLCIDYRALNSKTIKNRYPLPLFEDQISNLSGNNFFLPP